MSARGGGGQNSCPCKFFCVVVKKNYALKKLHLFICPSMSRGGEGLKALVDRLSKKVGFLWTVPLTHH